MDLDLGLAFALVGEQRYQEVAERLRNAKFTPDENEDGKPTRQRWRISDPQVTVDFLIEPEKSVEAQAGRLFDLTKDWAAIIAPGLHLAFKNNRMVTLSGKTIAGETAEREIRVCGAGAFVVLKALVLPAPKLRARCIGCGSRTTSLTRRCKHGEGNGILAW
jgi:hypothetical protein